VISRVAYISMHTSPLHVPGQGDAGGMNVYLDRLAQTMARRGIDVTIFTRRVDAVTPTSTEVREGYRVVNIDAGPGVPLPRSSLVSLVPDFTSGARTWIEDRDLDFDLVHSHYWLSGRTGLALAEWLDVPLANSFHTLGRVKDAAASPDERPSSDLRVSTELEVIERSSCVIASTPFEFDELLEYYGASPERLCVSPPGVDHETFRPGSRTDARLRLGIGDGEMDIVLYAGRIQAHKGTSLAVETLARIVEQRREVGGPHVQLHVVGGESGEDGADELARCRAIVARHGLDDHIRRFAPVDHPTLAEHYRSANVVIVPSRSESFGLVAAEAQASGVPVVASNIGGLPYVVNASESGLLVDDRDPAAFAAATRAILDHPSFAERLGDGAVAHARRFSWDATATRMLELYDGITA
jgi:D-inositol-3-phosphate glycosyltransferase